jgi:hypothetical protein
LPIGCSERLARRRLPLAGCERHCQSGATQHRYQLTAGVPLPACISESSPAPPSEPNVLGFARLAPNTRSKATAPGTPSNTSRSGGLTAPFVSPGSPGMSVEQPPTSARLSHPTSFTCQSPEPPATAQCTRAPSGDRGSAPAGQAHARISGLAARGPTPYHTTRPTTRVSDAAPSFRTSSRPVVPSVPISEVLHASAWLLRRPDSPRTHLHREADADVLK